MAAEARGHVREFHLQGAMVDYVIDETLRADGRGL
jgi:hypothetical protein